MIVLDYRDKRPLYEQVSEKLKHLIICGALEPNSKLPSVRALAMDLSINPNTIQRAYAMLEQEGYIYTVVGRGNFVTDSKEWLSGRLKAIEAELSEQMVKAKDAGLDRETMLRLVDHVYGAKELEITHDSEQPSGDATLNALHGSEHSHEDSAASTTHDPDKKEVGKHD
ncbi:MAG: GntR family transcriptional regulator [Lachnospiraceae bacterium]|nr:GntR family transcriptional regulator [Lachnospiraceae bacterium]